MVLKRIDMNIRKRLLLFVFAIVAILACNRQDKTEGEDVCLNNKGFDYLMAYYDECDDEYLDSARFFFEEALKCNSNNPTVFSNLILVLGAQEEYGEMIELYQKRIGQISEKAYLAKAETYSSLALLYGKTGDSLSYFKMTHYASNEFEKCFSQKPITVDLVGSFLVFVAYRDGKDSALIELKKYRDVFPDEDFYSVFENQLMEFNPDNDFNSRCH